MGRELCGGGRMSGGYCRHGRLLGDKCKECPDDVATTEFEGIGVRGEPPADLPDELPGMWEMADLEGGATDHPVVRRSLILDKEEAKDKQLRQDIRVLVSAVGALTEMMNIAFTNMGTHTFNSALLAIHAEMKEMDERYGRA